MIKCNVLEKFPLLIRTLLVVIYLMDEVEIHITLYSSSLYNDCVMIAFNDQTKLIKMWADDEVLNFEDCAICRIHYFIYDY